MYSLEIFINIFHFSWSDFIIDSSSLCKESLHITPHLLFTHFQKAFGLDLKFTLSFSLECV